MPSKKKTAKAPELACRYYFLIHQKPVKGHIFVLFAEPGPANKNNADAEHEIIPALIQENIILTEKNPKFIFQTECLGTVQGLLVIHLSPPTYAILIFLLRCKEHHVQLRCNIWNKMIITPPHTQTSIRKATSHTAKSTPLIVDPPPQRGRGQVCFTVSSLGLIYWSLQALFISAAKIK